MSFGALEKIDLSPVPDGKVHGANMGPTWGLLAPDGSHVGPMNLVIRDVTLNPMFPMFYQIFYVVYDPIHYERLFSQ